MTSITQLGRRYFAESYISDNNITSTDLVLSQEDTQRKATSFLFSIKMIAKLERTRGNIQQNKEQLQNSTTGVTITNEQTRHLRVDSSLSQWRGEAGGGGLKCILLECTKFSP